MEEYKDIIIEYINEYKKGDINDIVRFLIEKEVFIKNLGELKESIDNILKNLTMNRKINYSSTTQNFFALPKTKLESYLFKNKLISYQNVLSGQFINYSKDFLFNYENLNNFLLKCLESLGEYECISMDNEKEILIATFRSSLIQTHIDISRNLIHIRAQMKPIITESEPFLVYVSNLDKTLKKDRSIYVPLNYGIYLIYNILLDFLKNNYNNLDLIVNSLEFIE